MMALFCIISVFRLLHFVTFSVGLNLKLLGCDYSPGVPHIGKDTAITFCIRFREKIF